MPRKKPRASGCVGFWLILIYESVSWLLEGKGFDQQIITAIKKCPSKCQNWSRMVKGEGVKWPHLKRWLRTSIFWSGSICNFWHENCGSGCQQGRALLWKSQIAWIYWVWQLKVWISSWQLLFLFAAWLALRPLSVQRAADFTWTHLKQMSAASRRQAGKAWAWELQESLENTRKSSWSWAETRRVLEKKNMRDFLDKNTLRDSWNFWISGNFWSSCWLMRSQAQEWPSWSFTSENTSLHPHH